MILDLKITLEGLLAVIDSNSIPEITRKEALKSINHALGVPKADSGSTQNHKNPEIQTSR